MPIEWNSATDSKVVCIDKQQLRLRHYEQSIAEHEPMGWFTFSLWMLYLAVVVGIPLYLLIK